MSFLRFILKTFIRIKIAILVILFTLSLALNIVLFMGGYLFSAINSGFEAVTGIQTIASRNKAQIADLSEEVIIERNTKRELKGQLRETSADLTRTRISVRSLENKTQKITDELVTERMVSIATSERSARCFCRKVFASPSRSVRKPW